MLVSFAWEVHPGQSQLTTQLERSVQLEDTVSRESLQLLLVNQVNMDHISEQRMKIMIAMHVFQASTAQDSMLPRLSLLAQLSITVQDQVQLCL